MADACSASASVSVDLPASGWLMTANVRRRPASARIAVSDAGRFSTSVTDTAAVLLTSWQPRRQHWDNKNNSPERSVGSPRCAMTPSGADGAATGLDYRQDTVGPHADRRLLSRDTQDVGTQYFSFPSRASSKTPPLASITLREATLSWPQMSRARPMPRPRATGSAAASIAVAWPSRRAEG